MGFTDQQRAYLRELAVEHAAFVTWVQDHILLLDDPLLEAPSAGLPLGAAARFMEVGLTVPRELQLRVDLENERKRLEAERERELEAERERERKA